MPERPPRTLIRILTAPGHEICFTLHEEGDRRFIRVSDPGQPGRGKIDLSRAAVQRMLDVDAGACAFHGVPVDASNPDRRLLYVTRTLTVDAYPGYRPGWWVRLRDRDGGQCTLSASEWDLLFGTLKSLERAQRAISTYELLEIDERVTDAPPAELSPA